MKRVLVAFLVACACEYAGAKIINYTAGSQTDPTDLCLAENWSYTDEQSVEQHAVPTAEDLAVINMGTVPASTLVMSENFTVAGLKFTSPTKLLIITNAASAASATLTIGACGITNATSPSSSCGLKLGVPVAIAAEQSWNMGTQCLYTCTAFSGTATFAINAFYNIVHYASPQYAGRINYSGGSIDATYVSIREAAKWADYVYVESSKLNYLSVYFEVPGTWYFSSVFPTGTTFHKNTKTKVNLAKATNATGIFDDNVGTFHFPDISYASPQVTANTFDMRGGSISSRIYFEVQDGTMRMSGGTITNPNSYGPDGRFLVGEYSHASDIYFYQTGGTINTSYAVIGGGRPNWASQLGYAEWIFGGGTLQGATAGAFANLIIPGKQQDTYANCGAGVFTMTGGVVNATVTFGREYGMDSNDRKAFNDFGLFRMSGGRLNLTSTGFTTGTCWNNAQSGAVTSNSTYRVSLGGGTIAPAGATLGAQMNLLPGTVSTIETAKDTIIAVPMFGEGTLRKTGTGDLEILDGTRMTGAIDVQAGSVTVLGTYADPDDATCIKWTGDSAKENGYADGNPVAEWPEANNEGALKFVQYNRTFLENETYSPVLPTLADNAFNGHAGVKFTGAGMYIPNTSNPLAEKSVFSVAVVFKDSAVRGVTGNTGHDWGYGGEIIGSMLGGWGSDGWGISYSSSPQNAGAIFGINSVYPVPSSRGGVGDGGVHVIIATLANGVGSVNVDGSITNKTLLANRGANENEPLYLGFHAVGNGIFKSETDFKNACFQGAFAEVRVYPDRALDEAEQNGLVRALLAKYGAAADVTKATPGSADGAQNVAEAAVTGVPAPTLAFKADDLTLAEGADVVTWSSSDGLKSFLFSLGGGLAAPKFVKGGFAGKNAVKFTAGDKTALGLAAADVPFNGKKSFACAVVFRTTTDGLNGTFATYDLSATGILGRGILSTVGNTWNGANGFGLSFRSHGTIAGTYFSTAATTADNTGNNYVGKLDVHRFKPTGLDDGVPHIVVYSSDDANNQLRIMTDGMYVYQDYTHTTAHGSDRNMLMGSMNPTLNKYFDGEIAQVQFFDSALSQEQMQTISESFAQAYKVRINRKFMGVATEPTARGVAVTNLNVAAGAQLNLVRSSTDPLTLTAGKSITGAGTVRGSVRFASGAVMDAANTPTIQDGQLADGAVVKPNESGVSVPTFETLTLSGKQTIDVSGWANPRPSMAPLFRVKTSGLTVDDGVTWSAAGKSAPVTIKTTEDNGYTTFRFGLQHGLFFSIR